MHNYGSHTSEPPYFGGLLANRRNALCCFDWERAASWDAPAFIWVQKWADARFFVRCPLFVFFGMLGRSLRLDSWLGILVPCLGD
jgi:hypothetical protein